MLTKNVTFENSSFIVLACQVELYHANFMFYHNVFGKTCQHLALRTL